MCSGILRAASDNSGSAIVEAVVVFPVIVLILLGIINITLTKYEDVGASCARHKDEASEWFTKAAVHAEDVLRTRWLLDEDTAQ